MILRITKHRISRYPTAGGTQKVQLGKPEKISIRGVIFDYGNVLCYVQQLSDLEGMACVSGIPVPRLRDLYWKFRVPYDRADLTATEYWQAVAGEEKLVLTAEQIARLIVLDTQGWGRLNEKTVNWAKQLRHSGLRLGLLSNMPIDLSQSLVANGGWASFFHHLTFSGELRLVKPDPAIYRACLQSMELPPDKVLFLDDLAPNLEAASRLGIHSVLFDTIEQTVSRVSERFDLPVPDFAGAGSPDYQSK
jgi:putative hydrolase of the HAD superfamily